MQIFQNELTLIFVYGTLKRGDCRNYLLQGSIALGNAVSEPNYRLYSLGSYPGLVEVEAGSGMYVNGELYAVTPECLKRLDDEEGIPEKLYERKKISLQPPHHVTDADAYYYRGEISGAVDLGANWDVTSSS